MAKATQGDPNRDPREALAEVADDMEEVSASDEGNGEIEAEGEEGDAVEASGDGVTTNASSSEGSDRGAAGNRIRDIMTAEPRTVTPDTPIEEAARLFAELDSGALPVVESDDDLTPIGMITDRDIVTRILAHGENPLELSVADCMTAPAVTVGQDDDVEDAVRILEQAQVRRAIVVNDDGECCGVIAQADLAFVIDDALAAELVRAISQPTYEEARIPEADVGPGPG